MLVCARCNDLQLFRQAWASTFSCLQYVQEALHSSNKCICQQNDNPFLRPKCTHCPHEEQTDSRGLQDLLTLWFRIHLHLPTNLTDCPSTNWESRWPHPNWKHCQPPYSATSHSHLNFDIYMDNFFTSTKLFQYFRNIGVHACGTVWRQAGIPKELQVDKTSKLEWDTHSGAVIGGVLAVFWQDNGPVMMMTTIHGMVGDQWEVTSEQHWPCETCTNGVKVWSVFGDSPRKELKILKVVNDYNHHMGDVDIADQLHSYYSTQQIAQRNWMPLFFWILDTVIVNCYLIAWEKGSLLTHREFQQILVWELIRAVHQRNKSMCSDIDQEDEGARKRTQREKVTKHFQLPNFRFAPGVHYPEWWATWATCQWCSWRSLKKQIFMDHKNPCQNQFWCIECDAPLCLNKTRSCFKDYHSP